MRIGIDYTPGIRQRAGIGRYSRSLVHALAELDRQNQYVLLYPGPAGPSRPLFPRNRNFAERPVALSERALAVIWHRLTNIPARNKRPGSCRTRPL